MTKKILSILSLPVLTTLTLHAGGDMAPVKCDTIPIPPQSEPSFYLTLSGGAPQVNDDYTDEEISATILTIGAGYIYNEYLSIEARYTASFDTSYDAGNVSPAPTPYSGDITNAAIYLKPTYDITEDIGIYALAGYGSLSLNDLSGADATEEGFQWGAGVSYAITENISLFAEYLNLYDDTGFDYVARLDGITVEAISIGVSYRF